MALFRSKKKETVKVAQYQEIICAEDALNITIAKNSDKTFLGAKMVWRNGKHVWLASFC